MTLINKHPYILAAVCAGIAVIGGIGCGVAGGKALAKDPSNNTEFAEHPMMLACVDPVSQETIFEQDKVLGAEQDYDLYVLQLEDRKVMYMQPTGVVCTLRQDAP